MFLFVMSLIGEREIEAKKHITVIKSFDSDINSYETAYIYSPNPESDSLYLGGEISNSLKNLNIKPIFKSGSDLRAEYIFRHGWGFPIIHRNGIKISFVSWINIKLIDVKTGIIVGEVEYNKPRIGFNSSEMIEAMFSGMMGDAKRVSEKSIQSEVLELCPDEWIDNQMPGIKEETEVDRQYYILDEKRREIDEFDQDWVRDNCELEKQIVW